ncbi:hypothetical protein GY45DRAFT_1376548 [Cubamyces sp. BRFM 1775]|nr:hypothetical protein GY45DRAFT_1376548 [Cubamyces sp. BRFM 1775]
MPDSSESSNLIPIKGFVHEVLHRSRPRLVFCDLRWTTWKPLQNEVPDLRPTRRAPSPKTLPLRAAARSETLSLRTLLSSPLISSRSSPLSLPTSDVPRLSHPRVKVR